MAEHGRNRNQWAHGHGPKHHSETLVCRFKTPESAADSWEHVDYDTGIRLHLGDVYVKFSAIEYLTISYTDLSFILGDKRDVLKPLHDQYKQCFDAGEVKNFT